MERLNGHMDRELVRVEITVLDVAQGARANEVRIVNRGDDEENCVWIKTALVLANEVLEAGIDYAVQVPKWLADREGLNRVD